MDYSTENTVQFVQFTFTHLATCEPAAFLRASRLEEPRAPRSGKGGHK